MMPQQGRHLQHQSASAMRSESAVFQLSCQWITRGASFRVFRPARKKNGESCFFVEIAVGTNCVLLAACAAQCGTSNRAESMTMANEQIQDVVSKLNGKWR